MRIYVACLASYNNGVLHGRWIDADSDVDVMQEEVNAILRSSRFPNVTVDCPDCEGDGCEACNGTGLVPSAEEFAIHDYDGIPSSLGEYPGLQEIADYVEFAEMVEDNDLAFAMVQNWHSVKNAESAWENYVGTYDSFRDYADESADEAIACHSSDGKTPQFLINYFDYESYARDLQHDMTALDVPNGVAIFHD